MNFSQRMGFKPAHKIMQVDEMDEDLRNRLFNVTNKYLHAFQKIHFEHYKSGKRDQTGYYVFNMAFIVQFLKKPFKDEGDRYSYVDFSDFFLKKETKWFEIYDCIEWFSKFLMSKLDSILNHGYAKFDLYRYQNMDVSEIKKCLCEEITSKYNEVLIGENSGYRLDSNLEFIKITNEIEFNEIDKALNTNYSGVEEHIKKAANFLSNRVSPDYRNSIKESISAIESAAKTLGDNPKGELRSAFKAFEEKQGQELHPAFREGLLKIYGFTSDAGGIRHSLLEENVKVGFDEAKLMLVLCSAFANYLIAKSTN